MLLIDQESFVGKVKKLYVQNPCLVSDLAFWKLAQMLREGETYSGRKRGIDYLVAIRDQRLLFYWSEDREYFLLTPAEIERLEFLVLHSDFYGVIADQLRGYKVRESNPLLYDFTFRQEDVPSDGFVITDFNLDQAQDRTDAAEMLNRCYGTDRHTPDELSDWTEYPVFDGSLWLWCRDRNSGEAVGLAISTYQASIRECYLDWIQVLPEYQGRGLGRRLVRETIRRAQGKSDIIRVTGTVDRFYQRCGFTGTESWRLISRL